MTACLAFLQHTRFQRVNSLIFMPLNYFQMFMGLVACNFSCKCFNVIVSCSVSQESSVGSALDWYAGGQRFQSRSRQVIFRYSPLTDVLRSHLHGGTSKDQSAKVDVHWLFCINLVCLLCVIILKLTIFKITAITI